MPIHNVSPYFGFNARLIVVRARFVDPAAPNAWRKHGNEYGDECEGHGLGPLNRMHADTRGREAEVTYYVALPFVVSDDGVAAGEPTECFNPNAAVMRAEAMSRKEGHVGAVAFSRTGDPSTGDFGDAKVIK